MAYAKQIKAVAEDWILSGGEDYELLFTTRKGEQEIRRALRAGGVRTLVTRIGRVVQGRELTLIGADGGPIRRKNGTFKHFA